MQTLTSRSQIHKFSSHTLIPFSIQFLSEFRHKCEQDTDCDGDLICSLINNATKSTGFNRAPVNILKLCQCPDRTDEYDDSCNGGFNFNGIQCQISKQCRHDFNQSFILTNNFWNNFSLPGALQLAQGMLFPLVSVLIALVLSKQSQFARSTVN